MMAMRRIGPALKSACSAIEAPIPRRTRIHESGRARQDKYGGSGEVDPGVGATPSEAAANVLGGIDPDIVGQRVLEGVRDGDLYIFTHPQFRDFTQARFGAILAAFDKSANSEALKQVKTWQPVVPRELRTDGG